MMELEPLQMWRPILRAPTLGLDYARGPDSGTRAAGRSTEIC